jgi:hypothetical protein
MGEATAIPGWARVSAHVVCLLSRAGLRSSVMLALDALGTPWGATAMPWGGRLLSRGCASLNPCGVGAIPWRCDRRATHTAKVLRRAPPSAARCCPRCPGSGRCWGGLGRVCPPRELRGALVLYQGARVSTHVVCLLSRAGRVRSPRSSRLAPESSVGRDRYTRGATAISWGAFLLSRVRVTAVPRTRQGRSDERPTPRARLPSMPPGATAAGAAGRACPA